MNKLHELYMLALELELDGECPLQVYEDIQLLEEALEIDDL